MRIFAIDDEKAPLYFISKAIKEACPNDEYKSFDDCNELIKAFKEELPDVVFLDIEMPEMSGIDLAKKLLKIKKDVNIIFATAYKDYALDAFNLNASSYIVKPASKEKIISALNNLRYSMNKSKDIVIKTFGNFDIFYKGNPVKFRSERSKEILAYLVDRKGSLISKKELGSIIYEDDYSRSTQATLSRNIKYLEEDLESAGIKDFFINKTGGYYVDLKDASCDLIDYLNGDKSLYNDEYMEQYSWSEYKKCNFD